MSTSQVGYMSQVFKLEVGLEIQNWELSVEMVCRATSLNEITKEVNADRKEKSRTEPWGTAILNISRDEEEPLSCLCQLLSPHPHNSLTPMTVPHPICLIGLLLPLSWHWLLLTCFVLRPSKSSPDRSVPGLLWGLGNYSSQSMSSESSGVICDPTGSIRTDSSAKV